MIGEGAGEVGREMSAEITGVVAGTTSRTCRKGMKE